MSKDDTSKSKSTSKKSNMIPVISDGILVTAEVVRQALHEAGMPQFEVRQAGENVHIYDGHHLLCGISKVSPKTGKQYCTMGGTDFGGVPVARFLEQCQVLGIRKHLPSDVSGVLTGLQWYTNPSSRPVDKSASPAVDIAKLTTAQKTQLTSLLSGLLK